MLHHCRAVARGCKAPFLVADLPYGSYEASPDDAVRVSLRFMKEGNCDVSSFFFVLLFSFLTNTINIKKTIRQLN